MTELNPWTWGIDVASCKVAFVAVNGQQHRFWLAEATGKGSPRLSALGAAVWNVVALHAKEYPPSSVWVEAPAGRTVEPVLLHAVGVVLENVYAALESRWEHPVPVELIAVGTWKKAATGMGHATKEIVMQFARSRGLVVDDQDIADALGVAVAGQTLVRWGDE